MPTFETVPMAALRIRLPAKREPSRTAAPSRIVAFLSAAEFGAEGDFRRQVHEEMMKRPGVL